MPKQRVTIDIEIPEAWEAEGRADWDTKALDEGVAHLTGYGYFLPIRLYLRRKWVPPKWLPEGCWVYQCITSARHTRAWWASPVEPFSSASDGNYGSSGPAYRLDGDCGLAALHGETFAPPPVDKIQVRHG